MRNSAAVSSVDMVTASAPRTELVVASLAPDTAIAPALPLPPTPPPPSAEGSEAHTASAAAASGDDVADAGPAAALAPALAPAFDAAEPAAGAAGLRASEAAAAALAEAAASAARLARAATRRRTPGTGSRPRRLSVARKDPRKSSGGNSAARASRARARVRRVLAFPEVAPDRSEASMSSRSTREAAPTVSRSGARRTATALRTAATSSLSRLSATGRTWAKTIIGEKIRARECIWRASRRRRRQPRAGTLSSVSRSTGTQASRSAGCRLARKGAMPRMTPLRTSSTSRQKRSKTGKRSLNVRSGPTTRAMSCRA
mmetsp:Transcript_23390/g.88816  ORF Transcript_23390/g.88816 Transcript_23390/m.88816 type:complete len:316 (+) Transcript_23390:717-1664(+)